MPRLPTPGGDNGNWGEILNEYLSVSHASDGTLLDDSVGNSQIASGSVGTGKLIDTAVTRAKLSDGVKDELDSKLENITGYVSPGSNVTMTGLGTLASPYLISSANSGGDVVGPGGSTDSALARFDGTSGKIVKNSQATISDSGALTLGSSSTLHATGSYVKIANDSGGTEVSLQTSGGPNSRSGVSFIKTSGTVDTPTTSVAGDLVGFFGFKGFDGTNTALTGLVQGTIDGAVSDNVVPMRFDFITGTSSSDRTERLTIKADGKVGIGTVWPTHSLTLPSTATGTAFYNTTDQSTNYERIRQYWSTNSFYIKPEAGGTGVHRSLVLQSSSGGGTLTVGATGAFDISRSTTGANGYTLAVSSTLSQSSGIGYIHRIVPTINQSGSAGYTALFVNPTETTIGTGPRLLADFQVGGTSKTRIDNTGTHLLSNGAGLTTYNTTDETTNYERVRQYWSSNQYVIGSESGGTGSVRDISIKTVSTSLQVRESANATIGFFDFNRATSSNATSATFRGSYTSSSGTNTTIAVTPTMNQSGTAGYTALLVNPTETTVGSGTRLLADFQVGGTSKFSITSTGYTTIGGDLSASRYTNATGNIILRANGGFHYFQNGDGTSTYGVMAANGLRVGGNATPTHALTIQSTATTGIGLYNTADETTNYERVRFYWTSNTATLRTDAGGTGLNRALQIGTLNRTLTIQNSNGTSQPFIDLTQGSTGAGWFVGMNHNFTATSGTQVGFVVQANVNQSSTAGYTDLLVNSVETTTGSGAKLLADFQVGGSSKVSIDTLGKILATSYYAGGGSVTTGAAAANSRAFGTQATGDTAYAFEIDNRGKLLWGSGTAAVDTNLYRSAADTLKTDDSLIVGGQFTIGSSTPTHTLTLSSTSTGFAYYNTSDQTTNYERARHYWGGSAYNITTENGGTGVARAITISANGKVLTVGSSTNGWYSFLSNTTVATPNISSNGNYTHSSGTAVGISIAHTINQTSTAGYTMLLVNPTETTVGSGAKLLADFQVGGTSKVTITNAGKITTTGGVKNRTNTLAVAGSTYTANADTTDLILITSPAANFTIANPSGTPDDGQRLTIRVKSGTTGYTPTWDTAYMASGMTALPTTALPASKTVTLSFIYDSSITKWVLLAADTVGY